MSDVVIVAAVRTPVGRFKGALAGVRADHLGALAIGELIARAGVDASVVDDVIFGCVTQVGEQSGSIARTALPGAGWPVTIPGLTIDRKCGSGEVAVHAAFGAIACGSAEVVVAGGAENMSRAPMGGNRDVHGAVFGEMISERFDLISQGEAAERLVDQWGLTRDALDAYAMESHRRAGAAADADADAGWFEREIVAVPVMALRESALEGEAADLRVDETIRRDTNLAKLGTLKTSFRPEGGRITAGNSSQISDAAAVLLVMSADKAKQLGARARARIRPDPDADRPDRRHPQGAGAGRLDAGRHRPV